MIKKKTQSSLGKIFHKILKEKYGGRPEILMAAESGTQSAGAEIAGASAKAMVASVIPQTTPQIEAPIPGEKPVP